MTTAESTEHGTLAPGELAFVEKVAEHYHKAHGVPHDSGRLLGYLMISDPPEQRFSQICRVLAVPAENIEQFAEQMVLAKVFERTDHPDGDFALRLLDDGWPRAVAHTFASWPSYHKIMQEGLAALADAPPERRRRLADLEELFSYLVTELPAMMRRYHERYPS